MNIGYSVYINMGGYIPSNYKINLEELNFIDLASVNGSNPGFEIGGTFYYRKIGLNLGFGYYKYEIDANNFQKKCQNLFPESNITTFISPKVRDIPIFTGISYYIKIRNLYIEPGFFVRLNKIIAPNYADTYFWENDSLIRSINYWGHPKFRLDYVPSLNIAYYYPLGDGYRIGIQISYQYSFSNPEYEYDKTDVNLKSETFTNDKFTFANKYSCSKINFGVILRFN
jgi:hypothetical protein